MLWEKNVYTYINILIRRKHHYKIWLTKTVFVPNTSMSLQTALAAEEHLAKWQFLLEEQALNKEKTLLYQAGTQRPTVFKREGYNLEPRSIWKVHRVGTSSYVRCVILTALKHKNNCSGHGKKTIKRNACKLLLDAFEFVGISRRKIIPDIGGVLKLGYN
jgi:hypothetical protein